MQKKYKITVVGMGYVGLSNAILLAQYNEVVVVEIIGKKVEMLNCKSSPILEKEIEDYIENKSLNLKATTEEDYKEADFIIIATPTNYDSKRKQFDTSCVDKTIERILKVNKKAIIVIKSTVPLGYTLEINKKYHTENIIFNPEFLREGKSLYDNLHPSRIIMGVSLKNQTIIERTHVFVSLMEKGAVKTGINVLYTNSTEAEAIKLFSNTYLALRVCFFNELDTYAESNGLNTKQIIEGVCLDSRIGNYYNNPSFGYGGYCLPKDTKQLYSNFQNIPNKIIRAIVKSNKTRKNYIAERILNKIGYCNEMQESNSIQNSTGSIGIYRLAMKTNSDNYRCSSVHGIIKYLKRKNVKISIYDPTIREEFYQGIKIEKDLEVFKMSADIIVANRLDERLIDVQEKVYTRDIYTRD